MTVIVPCRHTTQHRSAGTSVRLCDIEYTRQDVLARTEEDKVRQGVPLARLDVEHGDRTSVLLHFRGESCSRGDLHIYRRCVSECYTIRHKAPHTTADVPTTIHTSALSISRMTSSIHCGTSVNQTTSGRPRAPHFVQRGSSSKGMSGSTSESAFFSLTHASEARLCPRSGFSGSSLRALRRGDYLRFVRCTAYEQLGGRERRADRGVQIELAVPALVACADHAPDVAVHLDEQWVVGVLQISSRFRVFEGVGSSGFSVNLLDRAPI